MSVNQSTVDFQEAFATFEAAMIGLARAMNDPLGKDRAVFAVAHSVRRLRRLLKAMEYELDERILDFLDGWPGTEAEYNNVDAIPGEVFSLVVAGRPTDDDRYEHDDDYRVDKSRPKKIEPFFDRDGWDSLPRYSGPIYHLRSLMERAYQMADDASPAFGPYYHGNQSVSENYVLTAAQRAQERHDDRARSEDWQKKWAAAEAERKASENAERLERLKPAEGYSIFDWETGAHVGFATVGQVEAWQTGDPEAPLLIHVGDDEHLPGEVAEFRDELGRPVRQRGWRYDFRRVKEGRKWVYRRHSPHADEGERAVRVDRNEIPPDV